MSEMDDFEKELKLGFLEEAATLLSDAEKCFLDLERNPKDAATLEQIFRIAHNIKGSAKAVGFPVLGGFAHEFENLLLRCKAGEVQIDERTTSLLLKCNDLLNRSIESLKTDPGREIDPSDLVAEIKAFTASPADAPEVPRSPEPEAAPPIDEPEASAELAPAPSKSKVVAPPQNASADESIRVSLARLDKLLNFVGEMVILQTVLREQFAGNGNALTRATIHQIGKVTKEVQELSMSLRMVQLKQTFQKMQRIVRDTAGQLGKKVDLVLEGEETEVDKTVLESLGDPLVHMVRNAVDHGIESITDRLAAGKSDTGRIVLRASHHAGRLVIEVSDDGGGISADRLRQKALEKGILKPGQAISDRDAVNLIFHPGFSTKAVVTDVSGRGVGMDVVKTNIERIQGEILIETMVGKGSHFKVVLPLTLAIVDGMVVRCGADRYVIPLSQVQESVRPASKDLHFSTSLGEVLQLRGQNLPVMRLAAALGKKPKPNSSDDPLIAVIANTQGSSFAVLVDDIIGQHQIVIKKLGSELAHTRGYGGSAVLGDGKPALIIELAELIEHVGRPRESNRRQEAS